MYTRVLAGRKIEIHIEIQDDTGNLTSAMARALQRFRNLAKLVGGTF